MIKLQAAGSSLRFVTLDLDNFDSYKDLIEMSEQIYPESIRTEILDYKEIISTDNSVAIIAFEGDEYVGNIIGSTPSESDIAEIGIRLPATIDEIIYVYNILVVPAKQGKGYGRTLMAEFMKCSKAAGYKFITGNFRNNGSYNIAKRFNPIVEVPFNNWESSGEDFVYCAFDIREPLDIKKT